MCMSRTAAELVDYMLHRARACEFLLWKHIRGRPREMSDAILGVEEMQSLIPCSVRCLRWFHVFQVKQLEEK